MAPTTTKNSKGETKAGKGEATRHYSQDDMLEACGEDSIGGRAFCSRISQGSDGGKGWETARARVSGSCLQGEAVSTEMLRAKDKAVRGRLRDLQIR